MAERVGFEPTSAGRYPRSRRARSAGLRHLSVQLADGEGLEPPRPEGPRFSRPVHYQFCQPSAKGDRRGRLSYRAPRGVVPEAGLEPARSTPRFLRPLRIPVPPLRHAEGYTLRARERLLGGGGASTGDSPCVLTPPGLGSGLGQSPTQCETRSPKPARRSYLFCQVVYMMPRAFGVRLRESSQPWQLVRSSPS